jgi:hypothetical protein
MNNAKDEYDRALARLREAPEPADFANDMPTSPGIYVRPRDQGEPESTPAPAPVRWFFRILNGIPVDHGQRLIALLALLVFLYFALPRLAQYGGHLLGK